MKLFSVTPLLLAIGLALAGCAFINGPSGLEPTSVDSSRPARMSLAEAKAIAIEMETSIERIIPASHVTSVEQSKTGTLLRCSGGKHLWSSMSVITLAAGSDVSQLLELVQLHFNSIEGYRAKITRTPMFDTLSIEINGPDFGDKGKNFYFVDEAKMGTEIEILAFSPCFYLEKGLDARGDF